MKGLILKDLINLRRQAVTMAVLAVFYFVFALSTNNPSMFNGIIAVMCAILPITAMSYDEKSRWDKYALSMPVSRSDIVLSKYLLGFLLSAAALVVNIGFSLFTTKGNFTESILVSLALCGVGILFISLILPVIFQFGVEKGRILMLIILFAPTGIALLLAKSGEKISLEKILHSAPYWFPPLVAIVLLGSVMLSLSLYQKKEL